jgi:hypothetical protein
MLNPPAQCYSEGIREHAARQASNVQHPIKTGVGESDRYCV